MVLPEQVLHRPFQPGPFRMAMDLVSVPEMKWFEFDQLYVMEMKEKRHLLAMSHAEVFAAMPVSAAARKEALELIVAALVVHHPDWFSRDGRNLLNRLTGESWVLPASGKPGPAGTAARRAPLEAVVVDGRTPSSRPCESTPGSTIDPLELAGRLVQEDLCLIQNSDEGPVFTAAALCFPSRWRLMDKIGKPLSAVHAPVPLYGDRLAAPVDRFMRHLKAGHITCRLNWSLLDDPALFQPTGKWRADGGSDITAANAGSRVFLRVERQTLRRLPNSGAVLFGIRVHVYPLDRVIDGPEQAVALAGAVRALPAKVQHYKSLLPLRAALLEWLDGCSAGGY